MLYAKIRDVKSPVRGTAQSAGLDFFVPNTPEGEQANIIYLKPGESVNIPSGIKVQVPQGRALVVMNKSGVAMKKSLLVGACVIDEDYQGEVHLHVINVGTRVESILPGEKLVQMLLLQVDYYLPCEVPAEDLFGEATERGEGGFGSTGTA